MAYEYSSPYKSAGFTRRELFSKKRKRDKTFDGIGKDYVRMQKKKKKKSTTWIDYRSIQKNKDEEWRWI